ncbi:MULTISPECIES: DUF3954 domain-containing protein [Bacillus cereus group]|uniref:DUF3954 domain-containing protein n=1 Tax=Bacillus cereus group TaxID=86661 RepID=UPI000BFBE6F5|nr:DUF3954 domain-containing protein [Bacillus wiedmannii]PHG46038.1 DUF3954 domain-containing protein [Bacillus wiedmannii]
MAVINEDIVKMKVEISLVENMIYVVKEGQIYSIEPPTTGYGEQSFVYKNGKVMRMEERKIQLL